MTVRVTEGVVALGRRAGDKAIHIRPGMQVSISNARTHSVPDWRSIQMSALAWRDRRIVIESQPLSSALAELDRYRLGRIVLLMACISRGHVRERHTDSGPSRPRSRRPRQYPRLDCHLFHALPRHRALNRAGGDRETPLLTRHLLRIDNDFRGECS